MNMPEVPLVSDFKSLCISILRENNLHHMVPAMDQIEFMRTKLKSTIDMYYIRRINTNNLEWLLEMYQ